MADAIRLQAEFTDDLGNDWQVNIHDSDYVGSIVPFKLGADGFVPVSYTHLTLPTKA